MKYEKEKSTKQPIFISNSGTKPKVDSKPKDLKKDQKSGKIIKNEKKFNMKKQNI